MCNNNKIYNNVQQSENYYYTQKNSCNIIKKRLPFFVYASSFFIYMHTMFGSVPWFRSPLHDWRWKDFLYLLGHQPQVRLMKSMIKNSYFIYLFFCLLSCKTWLINRQDKKRQCIWLSCKHAEKHTFTEILQ